jgi:hypothetical protein
MSCNNAVLGHPNGAREPGRVALHAADMRLGGLILRVDCQRQRFNRGKVQIRHLLDVPLLVLDASEINLVGSIRQVEWSGPERRHPIPRR